MKCSSVRWPRTGSAGARSSTTPIWPTPTATAANYRMDAAPADLPERRSDDTRVIISTCLFRKIERLSPVYLALYGRRAVIWFPITRITPILCAGGFVRRGVFGLCRSPDSAHPCYEGHVGAVVHPGGRGAACGTVIFGTGGPRCKGVRCAGLWNAAIWVKAAPAARVAGEPKDRPGSFGRGQFPQDGPPAAFAGE